MMLSRSNDVEIEFDFDKVIEKSKIIKFIIYNIAMHGLTHCLVL